MFPATLPPPRPSAAPRYDPDLDLIRDPRTGRYSCVYDAKHGRWRARVLKHVNLGMFATDVDAARRVVEWYKHWYGPRWLRAWRARKRNPWRVMACPRRGGFVAEVYCDGIPVRVTRATALPGRPPPRRPAGVDPLAWAAMKEADLWPTYEAARSAAKAVIVAEMGLFARLPLLQFWRG